MKVKCLNCRNCVLIGEELVCSARSYQKVYDRTFEEYIGVPQAIVSRNDYEYFWCEDHNFEPTLEKIHTILGLYEVSIICENTLIKKVCLHIYSINEYHHYFNFSLYDWVTYFCGESRVVRSLATKRPISDFKVSFKMIS